VETRQNIQVLDISADGAAAFPFYRVVSRRGDRRSAGNNDDRIKLAVTTLQRHRNASGYS
jgi:hypothetical protein